MKKNNYPILKRTTGMGVLTNLSTDTEWASIAILPIQMLGFRYQRVYFNSPINYK